MNIERMPMSCEEIRREDTIERYVLDHLGDDEKERFERHYFACESCFRELKVQMDLREILGAPDGRSSTGGTGPGRRWIATWLALAASAMLAVALGWVLQKGSDPAPGTIATDRTETAGREHAVEELGHPPGPATPRETLLAELAEITPPEYAPPALRGTEGRGMQRFRKAMEHYARRDFETAIPLLEEATRLEPGDPGPAFFLGISCLMMNRVEPAVENLRRAVDLGDTPYLEEALYYLAKAYLRQGDQARACEELKAIVELRGDLEGEAADLLLRIEDPEGAPTH